MARQILVKRKKTKTVTSAGIAWCLFSRRGWWAEAGPVDVLCCVVTCEDEHHHRHTGPDHAEHIEGVAHSHSPFLKGSFLKP